jgi:F420-non-reducing hydrogenase small subunit
MSKPKVAFYWCASCGGCEETVVDLAEDVLKVVAAVDIAFWPVALDFKREDVERMADEELAVSFINGAIRTSEQEEMVEMLRAKSSLVIAFGSCSQLGGIPGLANLYRREDILDNVYFSSPVVHNPDKVLPTTEAKVREGTLTLPSFAEYVRTLDQTIEVDYYLPGCPPPTPLLMKAVAAILAGELPPRGTVLAPDKALCEECDRRDSKPDKLLIKEIKRPHQVLIDQDQCLLAQGLLCLGPATRSGCEAACVKGNMPCTGCMGPTSRVLDQGAKGMSAIASVLDAVEEKDIDKVLDGFVDPLGTFYRYSLPASLLYARIHRSGGAQA